MALAAYRHLLRATRIAFQGDFPLLHAARTQARQGFDQLRLEDANSEAVQKGIQHAEEVAQILRKNIVQGVNVEGSDSYKLRIHEDTERGDNQSVKVKGKNINVSKACS